MRKVLTMTIKSGYSGPEQDSLWGTGFERIFVSHYDEVLEGICTHAPDLVVLDGLGKSCLEKAKKTLIKVRRQKEIKYTSLVVLTSLDISPSEEEQLINAGANIIIPVPSDPKLWNLKLERLINIPNRHRFRVPVQIVAWAKVDGRNDLVQGMALNINLRGMLLQLPLRLAPEGKFDLIFNLPGGTEPLSLVGRIVWRNEASQKYGIEFLVYRGESRDRLARFLDDTYEIYEIAKESGQYLLGDASREAAWEILLRTSEARKKAIMDAASDCIIAMDHENHILEFNEAAEKTFGISKNHVLLNRSLDKLLPQDLCKSLREQLFEFVAKGVNHRSEMVEAQGRRADGSVFPIEINSYAMYFEREPLLIVYLRDISERKRIEEEWKRLEENFHQSQKIESVGRLAGGVAHDYNNMLSVIIGNAELALMKAKRSAPLNDNLEHILEAANRSRDITRQLLAFARKQIINPKVLDLNVAVESMLKMIRNLLGENINLRWQPKEGLWQVKIDPSQLDQVLANLCINARDAITENGKITIETATVSLDEDYCEDHPGFICGNYVVLSVSDNGCGMDKETLGNVFEPFFTTKQTGEGTGLGMATVYGIVKQSGGFINVYSEPNQGTAFEIYFPRYEGEDVVSQVKTVSDIQMGQGETVLLVEDEIAIVKLATAILEDLGYRVLPANSPVEALNLLKKFQGDIQLLLADVVMPGMNGRELAKQVQDIHPKMKTLYMSGYTANVIAHHGVLDEGINFIQKPFSRHALSLRVREILDSNA